MFEFNIVQVGKSDLYLVKECINLANVTDL